MKENSKDTGLVLDYLLLSTLFKGLTSFFRVSGLASKEEAIFKISSSCVRPV